MSTFHLVQTHLFWEDPVANCDMLADKLKAISGGIIVLPEMFSTGFSMSSSELAETMQGQTVQWIKELAASRGSAVCGSVIIRAQEDYFNRFIWQPGPQESETGISHYDKRHLFRMADEHHHYAAGSNRIVITHESIRIMPQICYDLRFPGWSRNVSDNSGQTQPIFDVLLYVANWPAVREQQWLTLLRARAIENLCYVVAVNRVGQDGNGVEYSGASCVIDPTGEYLMTPAVDDCVTSIDLDLQALQRYREGFPAYLDADSLTFRQQ